MSVRAPLVGLTGIKARAFRRGRPRKDDVCTACGVRTGTMLLCGKMALVLGTGCCDGVFLCASCIGNRRHRHTKAHPMGVTA